ncbi:radical SAM protein [Caldicellulosiruptoraceae bacterium PP1]
MQISNIRWEIEPRCNLKCKHCFIGSKLDDYSELKFEDAKRIIDKLVVYGTKSIFLSTKEPLLFKDIDKLILYCTIKGIHTELITNGILLQDELFAERIINSGVGSISISLEGISKESNDYIRGEGTLEKIINALNVLKKIANSKKQVPIVIQMSLNKKNKIEAKHIPEFFNALPIDALVIGGLSMDGNAKDNSDLLLTPDEFVQTWEIILENYFKLNEKRFYINSKSFLPIEAIYYNLFYNTDFCPIPPRCGFLTGSYSLLPNGDIVPCVAILDKENEIGILPKVNFIKENESEEKVEQFANFKTKLNQLIKSNKPESCLSCYWENECIPCPSGIIQKQFNNEISARCINAKKRIESYLKDVKRSANNYYIFVRENTLFHIKTDKLILIRYYEHGGLFKKVYKSDLQKINILQKIFDNKEIKLEDLINEFNNYQALINFLKTLVYDNFILFRRI